MKGNGNIILLIVVVVLLVGMIVFSYFRKRKYNNELGQMRKDLKIGDKVMTDTGVVGTLVDTYEEEGYQYFVLKSGAGDHYGYFAVHANAIYYVFGKDKAEKKPNLGINQKKVEDTEAPKPADENSENQPEGENPAEKPAENVAEQTDSKPKTTKKQTTKRTSSKTKN